MAVTAAHDGDSEPPGRSCSVKVGYLLTYLLYIYCISTPGGVCGHRVQPVPALPRLVTQLQVAEHDPDPSLLSPQITVAKSVGYDPQILWLLYKISSLPSFVLTVPILSGWSTTGLTTAAWCTACPTPGWSPRSAATQAGSTQVRPRHVSCCRAGNEPSRSFRNS